MPECSNREIICQELLKAAGEDRDLVVLCSDSRGSASLAPFAERFPSQFVELGIAEQNLVSVAAGTVSYTHLLVKVIVVEGRVVPDIADLHADPAPPAEPGQAVGSRRAAGAVDGDVHSPPAGAFQHLSLIHI